MRTRVMVRCRQMLNHAKDAPDHDQDRRPRQHSVTLALRQAVDRP